MQTVTMTTDDRHHEKVDFFLRKEKNHMHKRKKKDHTFTIKPSRQTKTCKHEQKIKMHGYFSLYEDHLMFEELIFPEAPTGRPLK